MYQENTSLTQLQKPKKKKEKSQVLFFVFNFVFVERWDLKFGITQKPQALCWGKNVQIEEI